MPALLTTDFQKAMGHSDRVFICAPADRHGEPARACASYGWQTQCVCISNGNPGASVFKRMFLEAGAPEIVVGELAGVSFLASLGEAYGVRMPVQRAFLPLASVINGEDYYGKGRTLKNLGLDGLTADKLVGKLLGT